MWLSVASRAARRPAAAARPPDALPWWPPQDLKAQDPVLYQRNGLLPMLERNMGIKPRPQRWQAHRWRHTSAAPSVTPAAAVLWGGILGRDVPSLCPANYLLACAACGPRSAWARVSALEGVPAVQES